jgi:hypothetical protein
MNYLSSWQHVPWHKRRSYWELTDKSRRAIRSQIEQEALAAASNPDKTLEAYINLPNSIEGRLVNADLLPSMLDSFNENPTQSWEALEDPDCHAIKHIHQLSRIVRDAALSRAHNKPVLMFLGGQASGSSTGAAALGPAFDAVFDAPHADLDEALFMLKRIQRESCEIHLAYVDRAPVAAMKAMLSRSERVGRYVPLNRLAHAHSYAPVTFLKLGVVPNTRMQIYHVRVDEEGPGRMTEGLEAINSVSDRPKPKESVVAYQIQNTYLSLLRTLTPDPYTWYPRDVLAGLNRTLDPWRRSEADHLLRRFFETVAQRSAEGNPGP